MQVQDTYIYDDGDNADDQHDITSAPKRSRLEDSSKKAWLLLRIISYCLNCPESEANCDEDHN